MAGSGLQYIIYLLPISRCQELFDVQERSSEGTMADGDLAGPGDDEEYSQRRSCDVEDLETGSHVDDDET